MVNFDSGMRKDDVIIGYMSRVQFRGLDTPNGGTIVASASKRGHNTTVLINLDRRDCIEPARVLVAATINTKKVVV